DEWRLGFRGEVPVREDRSLRDSDYEDANLILFGDPGSNEILAKVARKLPIRWTREGVKVGDKTYGPDHVPVLVYPNPLNKYRYVVINTGHTWTAKDLAASNAYLTPKLPDWAVLKLGGSRPEVVAADYFDESWKLK
ncbi:MAG TPA: hydrolase, partial [Armatimonadota bacterium]|nr:hydrolase [Armatimonadota bacterium]